MTQTQPNHRPLDPLASSLWKPWMPASALLFFSVFLFLHHCWEVRNLSIDDAFITYRFAARLAHEGTLRWNLLEPPVEGFTSFLAVLISALFLRLDLNPLTAWKCLGMFAAAGSALCIIWGARAMCRAWAPQANRIGIPLIVAACYLATPLVTIHAMSGMETALFGFLLIALTSLSLRLIFIRADAPIQKARYIVLAFGFLLLGMTRPEGVLWAGIVALAVWTGIPRVRRKRFLVSLSIGFVLPGAIYFLARVAYFHSLLPATFHAKAASGEPSGMGRLHTWLPSLGEVSNYLSENWGAIGIIALAAGICYLMLPTRHFHFLKRKRFVAVLLLALASLACIGFFAHIHMLMGYANRFLFPFGQTFLLTLLLPGMIAAVRIAELPKLSTKIPALLIIAAMLCASVHAKRDWIKWETLTSGNNRTLTDYRNIGTTLNEVAKKLDRQMTLVHHNMGELMFFAPRWDSVDPIGLVDLHVARNGFSANHAFARKPDLFILPSNRQDAITAYNVEARPFSDILYNDPRINDFLYLGAIPFFRNTERGLHFFIRRTLATEHTWLAPELQNNLKLTINPNFPNREK